MHVPGLGLDTVFFMFMRWIQTDLSNHYIHHLLALLGFLKHVASSKSIEQGMWSQS